MKPILFAIVFALLVLSLPGKSVTVLTEIFNPGDINVDEGQIYITQEAEILIYSRKDLKLKKRFGKRGEGPREFRLSDDNMVALAIHPDYLIVNSVGRISYFKKNGDYIREIKNPAGRWMVPLGKNFAGMKRIYDDTNTRYRKLFLFNKEFKEQKIIYQEYDGIQPRVKVIEAVTWPSVIYTAHADKIFVRNKEAGIHVYDQNGEKLYRIKLPFQRIKVTSKIREKFLKFYRHDDPYWRVRWERLKSWYKFPDYLPVIQTFNVSDGHIYIVTYHTKDRLTEILVLDLKGNYKKRDWVPLVRDWGTSLFNIYSFDIYDNKIYQIAENPDEEEYELHIFDLGSPSSGEIKRN